MAQRYEQITPKLHDFIGQQPLFFVATAPLSATGHVNVSPKGLDSLRILSPNHVAYLDLTGSGNETSAHLRENGRMTLMFCAFSGAPQILRLYGTGRTILPNDHDWHEFAQHFTLHAGTRQIISMQVDMVQTSCGFAVPLLDFVGQRDTLIKWAEHHGEETLAAARREKNARSLDGLITPLGERGIAD